MAKIEYAAKNQMANTAPGSSARYRPSAVELAQQAERDEQYARQEALRMASGMQEHPEDVVRRAEAYYAFLRGQ